MSGPAPLPVLVPLQPEPEMQEMHVDTAVNILAGAAAAATLGAHGQVVHQVHPSDAIESIQAIFTGPDGADGCDGPPQAEPTPDPKPYGCTMCQKRFKLAATARDHERVHTGSQPYNCESKQPPPRPSPCL